MESGFGYYNTTVTNNYTTMDPELAHNLSMFSYSEALAMNIIIGVLCVVGIASNAITFAVIASSPRLNKMAFNIFLMGLMASDLASAVDSIFIIYRMTYGAASYGLPLFICKITVTVDFTTTIATIHLVMVFCILRLLSIKYPLKISVYLTSKVAKICVIVLWIESALVMSVFYFIIVSIKSAVERKSTGFSCAIADEWASLAELYRSIAFPFVVYIPMIVIILCTIIIIITLLKRPRIRKSRIGRHSSHSTSKSNMSNEKVATLQVSLILLSFFFGYGPFLGYSWIVLKKMAAGSKFSSRENWLLAVWTFVALRISECVNPLFYNLSSSKLRRATKQFLRRGFTKRTATASPSIKTISERR
ncbi:somatostatin receptor type 2-like [Styela clava]